MAFVLQNFARSSIGMNTGQVTVDGAVINGPAIFSYHSADDTAATIAGANYFANAVFLLTADDLIYCVGTDTVSMLKVAAVDRSAKTITTLEVTFVADGGITTAKIADDAVTTPKLADDAVDNSKLADNAVLNANVDAAAAIDYSKLAALASANILVGSAGNVATVVAMSGDVAIDDAGATTIQADAVDKAMLAATVRPSHMIVFADQLTTVGGDATEAFTVTGAVGATDRAFVQVVADGTGNVTVLQAAVTDDTLTVTFSANPVADTVFNYQLIRATS